VRLAARIVLTRRRFLTDRPLRAGSAGCLSTARRPGVVDERRAGALDFEVEGNESVSGLLRAKDAAQI
jgi:hypothetical protein